MTALVAPADMRDELTVIEVGCAPGIDYSDKPNEWLDKYLNEYAWATQREIWESVAANRATAVLSCNNSGKTWLAARIVVWWIMAHWKHGVRVVTTAPTAAQVSLLLWQEIRDAHTKAKGLHGATVVPGRIIGSPYPQWKIGDKIVGFGRKPADHEQSAMQGVHARYVLAVIDEAGGVAQAIYDAIDKIMTNEGARALLIGNPDNRAAPFGKVTQPGSGWNVIRVDGLRTPNFTRAEVTSGKYPFTEALMRHEGIPYSTEALPAHLESTMREHLLHPLWVEERFTRWCGLQPDIVARMTPAELGQVAADAAAQSQLFVAAVRGDFPDVSGDSVIPLGWAKRAMERWQDWNLGLSTSTRKVKPRLDPPGRWIIGCDVATTNGADETVVAPRKGHVWYEIRRYPEGDTHRTAGHVLEATRGVPLPQTVAVVDGIGIGAGVRDVLRNDHGMPVVSFEAYLQSDRTDRHGEFRFLNDRAAAWWRMRELLDPTRGSTVCLPPDQTLLEELTAPKWWVRSSTRGGVIQVESKDDIRKRLGRSTDSADAVIQAAWIDGAPVHGGPGGDVAIPWANKSAPAADDRPPPNRVAAPAGGGVGMVPYVFADDER